MNLFDLVNRTPIALPWKEGDNIPWNDPDFSQRMLAEHLSQEHNAASRTFDIIDQHVEWIHNQVLGGKNSKILDLGCGPGLYCHRLSMLGHQCSGIDYSPASITHARKVAEQSNLTCTFLEADLREADYGDDFDVIMQIYGEMNVFKPVDFAIILNKAYNALKSGGILLLELHTFEAVQAWGTKPPSWYASTGGLFSPEPHLVLEEYFWNPSEKVTTNRYFVIEAPTGNVIRYAQSVQAYTNKDYRNLLEKCKFTAVQYYPSLIGKSDPKQPQLIAILSLKPG